jgi:hypothetical protein
MMISVCFFFFGPILDISSTKKLGNFLKKISNVNVSKKKILGEKNWQNFQDLNTWKYNIIYIIIN